MKNTFCRRSDCIGIKLRHLCCLMLACCALLFAGFVEAACGSTYTIVAGSAASLVGSPFSACSISANTVTCSNNVTVNTNNVCVYTTATSITINMLGNTLNWNRQNGVLGSSGHTINVTAATINLTGNNFTSYGDWTGTAVNCSTNSNTVLHGTVTPGSCTPYATNPVSAPTVITGAASAITGATATLNGTVSSNGASTTVTFEYGLTNAYGSSVSYPANPVASGASGMAVTVAISGLSCNTLYHFRVKGVNSAGTGTGSDATWTTSACSAGTFDAYETSYSSADAISNVAKIKTHVASNTGLCVNGGACNIKIGSFNLAKSALNTNFTGPVLVEIVNVLTGNGCTTATSIATVSAMLTLSATGETSVTLPSVPNSYPNARIRVSYPASGAATAQNCSVDNFAIRPASFANVSAKDATPSTPGNTNSLSVSVLADSPIHKAGQPFSLNATAVNAAGATTSNYSGTPTAILSQCAGTACPGTLGTLTLGGSFSAGVFASSAASYSEVGAFSLVLQDSTFSAVDASDSSTTLERYISSATIDVGRFVPDHFAVSAATLTNACTASSVFSYFSQDGFTTAFTVTAQNAANLTTQNYTLGFAKLTLSTYLNYGFSAAPLPVGSVLASSSTAPTGSWFAGVANVIAKHQISRPTALTGPTAITLSAAPSDGEVPAIAATPLGATANLRYGRMRMQNAHGSELLDLPVPLIAQYWNGSLWVQNIDDSCTPVVAPTSGAGLTFVGEVASNVRGNHLSAAETTATVSATTKLVAGDAKFKFSKPGAGNSGYVDIAFPVSDWLKFPWKGGANIDPYGRATFGVYKNANEFIYLRELH